MWVVKTSLPHPLVLMQKKNQAPCLLLEFMLLLRGDLAQVSSTMLLLQHSQECCILCKEACAVVSRVRGFNGLR